MTHSSQSIPKKAEKNVTRRKKRKIATIVLSSIFLFIALVWLIYWLIWGQFQVYTDDAYVKGNVVALMAQVPGTVVEINADDTDLVHQGQVLIKLDATDKQIAWQEALALLARTVRSTSQAFDRAEQMQALVILRAVELKKSQLDFKRRVGLINAKAISTEAWQHAQMAVEYAKAQYYYALHQLSAARAVVDHVHLYHHPEVEQAKAAVKMAYLNLQRTHIIAPVTGYISKRNVQVGQAVAINTPMLAIVPLNKLWVEANYKESELNDLRIGQSVTMYVDAYPDATYHGKIVGLSAGTGAAFSLLPPQNATGNWIKIVQRLPVRISLDSKELADYPLQIGLSMRVTTHINGKSGHRLALKPIEQSLYSTQVYDNQLGKVDQIIDQVLKENSPDKILSPLSSQDKLIESTQAGQNFHE